MKTEDMRPNEREFWYQLGIAVAQGGGGATVVNPSMTLREFAELFAPNGLRVVHLPAPKASHPNPPNSLTSPPLDMRRDRKSFWRPELTSPPLNPGKD